MNKIEIIFCWGDGTWTTEILDIPDRIPRSDLDHVDAWITEEVYPRDRYRNTVYIGVFNYKPESNAPI